MNIDLTDKHALVCGASQGIGRAAANALAAAGARVTLLARKRETLDAARGALPGDGHAVLAADLGDPESLREIVDAHIRAEGPIHILVNNSGGPAGGPAHLATSDAFEVAFRQHLLASQQLVQAVLPGMRKAGFGRVINVISTSVKEPIRDLGVSNTVRGAVASWAKTLATELGPDGITVNNVLPGFTATGRLDYIFDTKAQKTGRPRAEIEAAARAQVPLGRFAEPAEIAAAIVFLASPAAAYINGINLPVDGGRTGSL
ncbi:MAG: SDR family oxidoreductase [Gammaproteobacteria bacterium]